MLVLDDTTLKFDLKATSHFSAMLPKHAVFEIHWQCHGMTWDDMLKWLQGCDFTSTTRSIVQSAAAVIELL